MKALNGMIPPSLPHFSYRKCSYAVPELVNSNRNDTADCIRKYEDFKKTGGIAAFFQGPKKEIKDEPSSVSASKKKEEEERKKKEEEKKKKPVGLDAYFKPKDEKVGTVKEEKEQEKEMEKEKDVEEPKEKEDFSDEIKSEVKVEDEAKDDMNDEAKSEEAAKDEEDQTELAKVEVKGEEAGEVMESKEKEYIKGGRVLRKRKTPGGSQGNTKITTKKGRVSKK